MTKTVKIVIVVAAFFSAGVTCLLILLTLAVPAMQKVNKKAHQTSAIASLRILNSMEGEYSAAYPQRGFACSLATLGGTSGSIPPTPDAAELIPADLASGNKAGYTFTISNCTKTTVNKQERVTGYRITAIPKRVGHTGNFGFCTDESTVIRFDPSGGASCTELLQ